MHIAFSDVMSPEAGLTLTTLKERYDCHRQIMQSQIRQLPLGAVLSGSALFAAISCTYWKTSLEIDCK